MKTPVIIPALNEELCIGRTLESLPADRVEPLVAVNGSTDRTAQIAEGLGAQVLNIESPGKLPAIQLALRALGGRALEPLLILDADTRPILPDRWHNGMMKRLASNTDQPTVVGGPVWFTEGPTLPTAFRSALLQARTIKAKLNSETSIAGANMALHAQHSDVLEELLALPHLWPGEDRAMTDIVRSHNGAYVQPLSLSLGAFTRVSLSYMPLLERLQISKQESAACIRAQYTRRAAPDSTPYI